MHIELTEEDSRKKGLRSKSHNPAKAKNKSGWLLKKSGGLVKKFHKRFLTLEGKVLQIYKNDQKTAVSAIVNFDQISAMTIINPKDPKNLLLSFKGNSTVFSFKGSAEEINDWSNALNDRISKSKGPTLNFSLFKFKEKFWRFDNMTEAEFRSCAETGDLIFFKGNSRISSAFRGILKSEFDHIALVYILNNYVYLFESSRSTGVNLQSWEEFVNRKWYELYTRIGFRKLDISRNQDFYDKSDDFIRESIGKPYKLIKLKNNDHTGYFCSELIAEFYRRTGIIYHNTPANKYFPKHFVSDDVVFIQGELKPLRDIRFINEN